jgi:hypothetical protein
VLSFDIRVFVGLGLRWKKSGGGDFYSFQTSPSKRNQLTGQKRDDIYKRNRNRNRSEL